MNDLIFEQQQYQEATVDNDEKFKDEGEDLDQTKKLESPRYFFYVLGQRKA